ncbi:MAG: LysR family transcriptional regulator [Clostridia bacterium]|nr:LysR family transcriptional regulator [Clostridia bacterium]
MINLDLYRVFYTVAKCGSLTGAAKELFISQPAVSLAVKNLETQLGGRLFNRTRNGIELTESGKRVFKYVAPAIEKLNATELNAVDEKIGGSLTICVSDTVSRNFLLPYVVKFHAEYPTVKLKILNCTSSETIKKLKTKGGDIGFINLPASDADVKVLDMVMPLHDGFFCSEAFKELTESEVGLGRLQDYPLLMLDGGTVSTKAVVSFAEGHGVNLAPEIELGSFELMTELCVAGTGIACIPKEFVQDEINSGKISEIKTVPTLPVRSIGLAVPKDAEPGFEVKAFLLVIGKNL